MNEEKSDFLVCDVCFNDQLLLDVNLSKTCSVARIVQGLWDDSKFREAASSFLKTKQDELGGIEKTPVSKCSLKTFHYLDRSILRAYVAIRFMSTWKWLELKDFIADFENRKEIVTVAEAFGSFCWQEYKPIIRIVPKRETEADDQEVKTIIQELLQTRSLATLATTGCPLSKGMLSLIGQGKYTCTISYDKREKFVHWLRQQDFTQNIGKKETDKAGSPSQPMTPIKIAKSRVTFEPDEELSKLGCWFDANHRPGKKLIEEYTNELNQGRCRKSKRMLTQESIAVWFKNRRAKAKKEESSIIEPWEKDTGQREISNANKDSGVDTAVTIATGDHNGVVDCVLGRPRNMVDNRQEYLMSPDTLSNERKSNNIEGNRIGEEKDNDDGVPVTMETVDNEGNDTQGGKNYTENATVSNVMENIEQVTNSKDVECDTALWNNVTKMKRTRDDNYLECTDNENSKKQCVEIENAQR